MTGIGRRVRDRGAGDAPRYVRRWAAIGLVAMITGLAPWTVHADEGWTTGRPFGLYESSSETDAPAVTDRVLAALTPGSVLTAQTGGAGAEPADTWQFSLAPYLWAARTKATLTVGQLSQSTTIDFVDVVPQLHFAFAAHFEATKREWTGSVDLLYLSIGQSETQHRVSVSTGVQTGFFEFGGTYRLGPVSLGQTGRLTFEPLVGGRFIWVHASLGGANRKVSDSGSVIDPMIGGRIAYHITDTVALWFRGDVAGFGISDNQTKLTYNLIAGVEWRFRPGASAVAGWRYMNIDLETGSGSRTLNADLQLSGPVLALNLLF